MLLSRLRNVTGRNDPVRWDIERAAEQLAHRDEGFFASNQAIYQAILCTCYVAMLHHRLAATRDQRREAHAEDRDARTEGGSR
jgi:hypothetical protein